MVFTTRLSGGKGGRNALEHEMVRLGVRLKNSRPNHPTTCGKAERFQQTLKKWLRAQPEQPRTLAELQVLLDEFVQEYNDRRPHRSLPHRATPATAYTTRPKASPNGLAIDSHDRVRRDRIDDSGVVTLRHAGRLHHIGIGRAHARTHVILLVQDLNIRIVHAAPASSCASSSSTPPRTTSASKGLPAPANKKLLNLSPAGLGVSDLLRDHTVRSAGFEPATS
jgi:hypothetical protein